MKYRLICLLAAVGICIVPLSFTQIELPRARYQQHLEEEGYTACTDHGAEAFCTHLPLLQITTEEEMPAPYLSDENGVILRNEKNRLAVNDAMIGAEVTVFDAKSGNNHLTDTPTIMEKAKIRVRGNSSRNFVKKSYLLQFVEEDGISGVDVALAGMTADNNWVLHGPVLDKTLLRNYLCYNLAGSVMDYVPEVRFCELFLNGEYMGVYLITEKISYSSKGRVHLTKTDPALAETSYILKLDTGDADALHLLHTFADSTGKRGMSNRQYEWLEVVYPSDTLTQTQKETIEYELSRMEKALTSFDSADEKRGYPAYLDVESFVNFFVLNEFMMNADAGRLSTYYCKDIRGKIKIIGWDYNNTFNNYFSDLADKQEIYSTNTWYSYLLRDPDFTEKVINTYRTYRKTILSEEYLSQYIDDTVAFLGPAIQRNVARWGQTFSYDYIKENPKAFLRPIERNPKNYEEAIAQMKDAIALRGRWMDENLENLLVRSHASANKQFRMEEDE